MAAPGARIRVPVAVACRVLGFTKQAHYQWLKQPLSARKIADAQIIQVLRELHEDDPEGGCRVLADDLHDLGFVISERRVWWLCKIAGIQSTITTRKRRYQKAGAPVGDELVQRDFTADGLDEKWLVDITEHWTGEGKLYLCAFKDVCSNKIVGCAIDSRMKASLAVRALENALMQRGWVEGVVVRSDRESQFRSRKFQKALKKHKLKGSMERVGITQPWSYFSVCCRRTCLIGSPGVPGRSSGSPSCTGLKRSLTVNANHRAWKVDTGRV